jgi:hypothetical protein
MVRKQTCRLITKALKEGFGIHQTAIDVETNWIFPNNRRPMFCARNVPINSRTVLNSANLTTVFPQIVRTISRKYAQKYANRDFLIAAASACDKSHQIAVCWNENC